jgi:hypothetical protein
MPVERTAVDVAPAFPHSPGFRGNGCYRSAKPSGGEDLEIEEPVSGRYASTFHFHATLASVLSPTLRGDQIIEVRSPVRNACWLPSG